MSDYVIQIAEATTQINIGDTPVVVELLGGQGGRGVTGATGAAGQSNELIVSKSRTYPWEDFDRPEGTLLSDFLTSKSGHAIGRSGAGAATAVIDHNGLKASGNVYMGMTDTELVTEVWGAISFEQNASQAYDALGAPLSTTATLMFNGSSTNVALDKLIHVEFRAGSSTIKLTETGAANLTVTTGTTTEVHGNDDSAAFHGKLDCTKYQVGLKYIQKASAALDELYVHLPNGRVLKIVGDTRIRGVMATCYHVTWQITADIAGYAKAFWHGIHVGPRRSEVAAAIGGAFDADRIDQHQALQAAHMKRHKRIIFTPTAVGWYKVAEGINPFGSYSSLIAKAEVYSRDNSGRQSRATFEVGVETTLTPRVESFSRVGGYFAGGGGVTKFRISRDSTSTGSKQLDVYVAVYQTSADRVIIDLEGQLKPVLAPVVGATALSGFAREQDMTLTEGLLSYAEVVNSTITPGVHGTRLDMINHYSAARDFSFDNAKAVDGDTFRLIRRSAFANNAVLKNLSDGSTITTLAPGNWAEITWQASSGLFVKTAGGAL